MGSNRVDAKEALDGYLLGGLALSDCLYNLGLGMGKDVGGLLLFLLLGEDNN